MRKILVLTPFDIFPPVHGGSTVVYNFIKYISRDNKIFALLSHLYSQRGKIDLNNENINIYYCPTSPFDQFRVFSFLFNPFYFYNAYKIMNNFNCDIIQCELLWTAFAGIFLKKKFNKPLVLVEHNIECLKFKHLAWLSCFIFFLQKIEKIACKFADKIVVFSETDKNYLINLYSILEKKVEVISPCVDVGIFEYNTQRRKSVRNKYKVSNEEVILTFVGNLKYIPNMESVKYIAEEIYPPVVKKYPGSKFLIIGQGQEALLNYRRKNIIFTGYLERLDLVDYLSASDIVMVPITTGSGVRIKILEGAACSRAIVSTEKGAEGLNFVSNREIMLSPKVDKKFVENIIKLIENKELRENLGEKAREKVVKEYSWQRKAEKFEKIYGEISN